MWFLSFSLIKVDLPDLGVGWIKQVDESGCNNDSGSEIASKEVDDERNFEPSDTLCSDWEESNTGGNDQDDEESRDACTKLAIVLIARCCQSADDLSRVCGVQVHIGRIKVGGRTRGSHYEQIDADGVTRCR